MLYTFQKEERLKSKKIISELMAAGKSFHFDPFRILWLEAVHDGKFPVKVLFSVPKKRYKNSVQRNRIKRRMREAYRKHKHLLYQALEISKKQIAVALIYVSPREGEYGEIEAKIILSLQRLGEKAQKI